MEVCVAAVDLGASSGRVMIGHIGAGELSIRPVARFPNRPVRAAGRLHWNILELYRNVVAGIAAAAADDLELSSVGIDSWAVDYGLLRGDRLLGEPVHYRDERTIGADARVYERVPEPELYARNGLQHLPFTTLYQLEAERAGGLLDAADSLLLVPDLLSFWLSGSRTSERTNASTTGLLGVETREWDVDLIDRLALPRALFTPLVDPATVVGSIRPGVRAEAGIDRDLEVITVASHDTASAVVAIPAISPDFAYISCGTWSLVGLELERPVVSEAGRLARFTNELGLDGRVRYLHNVMGLWLFNESMRVWKLDESPAEVGAVVERAAQPGPYAVFDPDDARFLPPGDMPARIIDWCREHDVTPPDDRVALVRSIMMSLAVAYAENIALARELTGKTVDTIHLVGGGSNLDLLCQLTADQSGIPVVAGPVEATAIGNILVQARSLGAATGGLDELRGLVRSAVNPKIFSPRASSRSESRRTV